MNTLFASRRSFARRSFFVAAFGSLILVIAAHRASAASIALDAVIGVPGTDAFTVTGVSNAVNHTGVLSNSGATTLTVAGSANPVSFNFHNGFVDTLDRVGGVNANAAHIWADRKTNSADPTPLIFDRDNNESFALEADDAPSDADTQHLGFGMHADAFITFNLDKIRSDNGLTADTAFTLSGGAGVANFVGWGGNPRLNSAAVLIDGAVIKLLDFDSNTSGYVGYGTYSNLAISGSAHYLTFAGMIGLDESPHGAHIGFDSPTLTTVPTPEPNSLFLLSCAAVGLLRAYRRRQG